MLVGRACGDIRHWQGPIRSLRVARLIQLVQNVAIGNSEGKKK